MNLVCCYTAREAALLGTRLVLTSICSHALKKQKAVAGVGKAHGRRARALNRYQ